MNIRTTSTSNSINWTYISGYVFSSIRVTSVFVRQGSLRWSVRVGVPAPPTIVADACRTDLGSVIGHFSATGRCTELVSRPGLITDVSAGLGQSADRNSDRDDLVDSAPTTRLGWHSRSRAFQRAPLSTGGRAIRPARGRSGVHRPRGRRRGSGETIGGST